MRFFVRIYSKIRRKKKELLLFICTLLILFLFFEISLRIFYPIEKDPYYDRGIGLIGPIFEPNENPNLPWRLIPNSEVNTGGIAYKINSKGLRDYEYLYEKQKNVSRILVMGDSVTMGYAINLDDTYPKQLEKLLKKNGKNFEVLNLGVVGYNTWNEVEYLKKEGLKYNPDMIIFGFILNDLESDTAKMVKTERICHIDYLKIKIPCKLEDNIRKIRTFTFIKYRLNNIFHKRLDKEYYNELYYERNSISDFSEIFTEISQFSQSKNIPVLFVIFPLIFTDYKNYPYEKIHKDLAKEMNQKNITFIDILSEYSQASDPLYVFISDSLHPNIRGNMIAAKAIYEFYQQENIWH